MSSSSNILNDDGSIKNISDWPKIWRQFISGIELPELFDGRGDDRVMIGLLKKIKWPDKLKNLELLGKHVDVMAWKERTEVINNSKHMSMEDLLEEQKAAAKKILSIE